MVLSIHLSATILALIIGFYLFIFNKKYFLENRYIVLIWVFFLWISAISGIFLNLITFSPFHILSIIVLTTTPLALYNYKKGKNKEYKLGLYYNFVGLCLAATGTLYPGRRIGGILFRGILNLDRSASVNIFYIITVIATLFAVNGIIKTNQEKLFNQN